MFFYNGLNFVLRGGQEHRELKISQLNFKSIPDPEHPGEDTKCVEYYSHGSKNRPGGREGKISVPVVKDNKTVASDIPEEKRDPSDLMKNLQFHNMQGCMFNISFKV